MKAMLMILAAALSIASVAYAGDAVLRDRFSELDTNGDQRLTEAEIRRQPELIRYTNMYSQNAFVFADVNEDGYVSMEEYVAHETPLLTD